MINSTSTKLYDFSTRKRSMLFTRTLLENYIKLNDTNSNIGNELTLKSCEIEGIEERTIPQEVVFWLVKEIAAHPDADKLVVCQIDCGEHGIVQICTAAENMIPNYIVPVALPWCFLPKLGFEIGERKMRGVASNGMICAKEELWINEDTDIHGIRNMQGETPNEKDDFSDISASDLGTPITTKYPRLNNVIFDVDNKTLTHRADMTGHMGMARELSSIYQTHFAGHIIAETFPTILRTQEDESHDIYAQSDHLRYYSLAKISKIRVVPSDFRTRLLLIDMGLSPRNNRVDISNLFMIETGQPIHCFDASKIEGDIIVRQAEKGETFIDLFDKEHQLETSDMIIADNKKIVALAGVIWSNNSWVDEETTDILVEVANFDPIVARRTATRLGIRTDAIMRYEKNINPLYTQWASHYFKEWIESKAEWTYQRMAAYIKPEERSQNITIDWDHTNSLIWWENHDYGQKIWTKILTSLGCDVSDNTIWVPLRRSPKDLNIPADIAEEIVRIYGYEKIDLKENTAIQSETKTTDSVALQQKLEDITHAKHNCDFVETYPWAHRDTMALFDIQTDHLIEMENSLSPETSFMSPSSLFNLVDMIKKNHKFFDTMRLATTTDVYSKIGHQQSSGFWIPGNINTNSKIQESKQLGILLYNKSSSKDRSKDLTLQSKSILADIATACNIELVYKPAKSTHFHPKQQAHICVRNQAEWEDIIIGFIGKIHPVIVQQMKLPEQAQLVYSAIDMPALSQMSIQSEKKSVNYQTIQDQILTRDINFVINKEESFDKLLAAIKASQWVEKVTTFDIYQWNNLPANKKSIALQITLYGDWSITNEQINEVLDKAIESGKKTGAILRKDLLEA